MTSAVSIQLLGVHEGDKKEITCVRVILEEVDSELTGRQPLSNKGYIALSGSTIIPFFFFLRRMC